MINWILIDSFEQLHEIEERSKEVPCIIFKHSIACSISALIKHRLESQWDIDDSQIDTYFLDIFRYRALSNLIAEEYGVRHESPQLLMIHHGKCVYHNSHLNISVDDLKELIQEPADT